MAACAAAEHHIRSRRCDDCSANATRKRGLLGPAPPCEHRLSLVITGTADVVFEPLAFMARLAPLVPTPRVNLTRYHDALESNH